MNIQMKKLFAMDSVALMLAACHQDEALTSPAVDEMTDTPVLINAGVAELTTRAGQPAGELKTGQLGFYMTTEGTDPATDVKYNTDNLQMSYQDGEGWGADNGATLLWKNKTSKVSYMAYHPFMEIGADKIADVVVPADQNVSVFDLLYAKGETTGQASEAGINLSLGHQMSKLTISLCTGTELGENVEYVKVTLKGLKNSCGFNMADGTWGTYAAEASDVVMVRNNNAEYEESSSRKVLRNSWWKSLLPSIASSDTARPLRSLRAQPMNLLLWSARIRWNLQRTALQSASGQVLPRMILWSGKRNLEYEINKIQNSNCSSIDMLFILPARGFRRFYSDSDAVQFTATVGDLPKTRVNPVGSTEADRTTFTEGEQIKVSADSQDAVTYTLENGVWKPEEGKFLKWNAVSMTFNAYYPVSYTGAADVTAETDQSDLTKIIQADYMKAENIVWDKSIGPVEFVMQRQTARVVISEIRWGNQYDASVHKISDLTLTDGVSGRIKPYEHEDGKYYALLMPTAGKTGLEGNFMEMTVGDGVNEEKLIVKEIPELEAGYSYECTLTVGKDKVEIISVTVEDWATGGIFIDGEGLTEEHIPYTVTEVDYVKTYVVDSEAGLRAVNRIITSDVSELNSGIILAADITLTGENNWTPIGNKDNPYTGIFNGNSKTITGLHIDNGSADYQGLIGCLADYGTVKDLTLADSRITGYQYVGGVVGSLDNYYSITNIAVKDCEINGHAFVGGVIGDAGGQGTISGATLFDSSVSGNAFVGGIVGITLDKIENCLVQSNTGQSLTIIAYDGNVGGIAGNVGNIPYDSTGSISGCKVINGGDLTISSYTTMAGGIAGSSDGHIVACLVQRAHVTAYDFVGGIVGHLSDYSENELYGCYAYRCTTGYRLEAFAGTANIVGSISEEYSSVSSCYYHAYNDSWELVTPVPNSSGEMEPGTPVDWTTASEHMNKTTIKYVWGGTYDVPTLTAR